MLLAQRVHDLLRRDAAEKTPVRAGLGAHRDDNVLELGGGLLGLGICCLRGGFLAQGCADFLAQGGIPAVRNSRRRGEAGGRNTGVQPQVVRRARLLAHAVRTIRKGDGRNIIFRQCTGPKGSSARKQRTFLL